VTLWVAFLYSVVLSAERRVKSSELLAAAAVAGLRDARTVLSTGNLAFRSDALAEAELAMRIEAAVEAVCGRRIAVYLRTGADLRAILDRNPFPEESRLRPASVAVRLMAAAPAVEVIGRLEGLAVAGERFAGIGRELWVASDRPLSGSALVRAAGSARSGAGTMRSISALQKIACAAAASAGP
jgi:uncharacterized protein (DUF1697 family)